MIQSVVHGGDIDRGNTPIDAFRDLGIRPPACRGRFGFFRYDPSIEPYVSLIPVGKCDRIVYNNPHVSCSALVIPIVSPIEIVAPSRQYRDMLRGILYNTAEITHKVRDLFIQSSGADADWYRQFTHRWMSSLVGTPIHVLIFIWIHQTGVDVHNIMRSNPVELAINRERMRFNIHQILNEFRQIAALGCDVCIRDSSHNNKGNDDQGDREFIELNLNSCTFSMYYKSRIYVDCNRDVVPDRSIITSSYRSRVSIVTGDTVLTYSAPTKHPQKWKVGSIPHMRPATQRVIKTRPDNHVEVVIPVTTHNNVAYASPNEIVHPWLSDNAIECPKMRTVPFIKYIGKLMAVCSRRSDYCMLARQLGFYSHNGKRLTITAIRKYANALFRSHNIDRDGDLIV